MDDDIIKTATEAEKELKKAVKEIVEICQYDLSANCNVDAHTEYVMYRITGGELPEDEWYIASAKGKL